MNGAIVTLKGGEHVEDEEYDLTKRAAMRGRASVGLEAGGRGPDEGKLGEYDWSGRRGMGRVWGNVAGAHSACRVQSSSGGR